MLYFHSGSLLWTLAENSYFGHGGSQMHFLWQQPFGSLWIMGRMLLTTCHVPWLGAALLTLLLTACAHLLRYTFRLRWGVEWLAVAAYLLWMQHEGFDLYYQAEPGRLHGIAFMSLVLLGVESVFLWSFRRKGSKTRRPARADVRERPSPVLAFILASIYVPFLYASFFRPYVRPVCTMQQAMDHEDWNRMAEMARDNAGVSTRPMAAYHAIALVRQDAVLDHLCDIQYCYQEVAMHDRAGFSDQGHNYFLVDCDFHAGLLQAAYRKAMEAMTMEGPTVHLLKRLCQVAVMRGERRLAGKYLTLLSLEPFCGSFVDEWSALNSDPARLEANHTVASIRRLEPLHDAFEGDFAQPAFLGYNISLMEGRSPQALENSIAVCLYTKLMPAFMERVRYMDAQRLATRSVALDALAMQAGKVQGIVEAVPAVQYRTGRYTSFLQAMQAAGAMVDTEERKPFAKEMLAKWPAYYPSYYFFGNLDATVKGAAEHYGYEGVN